MPPKQKYTINTEVRFNPLEVIDIGKITESCQEQWFNQTLCRVNDCVVRIGVLQGEFHWHKHDGEDEFFYVVDGLLLLDLEDRTIELYPKQGITVPRGVVHKTRAPERSTILMIAGSTIRPTGDPD